MEEEKVVDDIVNDICGPIIKKKPGRPPKYVKKESIPPKNEMVPDEVLSLVRDHLIDIDNEITSLSDRIEKLRKDSKVYREFLVKYGKK